MTYASHARDHSSELDTVVNQDDHAVTNARAYVQIPSLDLNYLWCVTPLC